MIQPKGTIVFSTIGRNHYGFDVFSISLTPKLNTQCIEHRLTDGASINFNGQFVDEDQTLIYVSERTGSAQIYLNRPENPKLEQLPTVTASLFHDRPVLRIDRLYYVSAHEPADKLFTSWSAVYMTKLGDRKIVLRLTPKGAVDYSPAVSPTGKFIAVASYGFRPWKGELDELDTDIIVFPPSDPNRRIVVCKRGGWPTWFGDSTIFFHRKADDGWWSIFRVDLPENFQHLDAGDNPRRITPPGVHAFTPSASRDRNFVAFATRRRESNFRHIEIFDLESESFYRVTESLNPNFHHYNPFFSPKGGFLGYHRFRGESAPGVTTIPHLDPIISPTNEMRLLRLNGMFPSFSHNGDFIAFNHDFDMNSGLRIVRRDGSKRWVVLKDRNAFCTSWNPTENNVIYTSIGPIFESAKRTVQIARISFDPKDLTDDREEIPATVKILTREDTGNNAFPSCSPDGKFLVFRSGRSGHKNLFIVDAVNGEFNGGIRQLTDGPWIDTMPSWSPDGKLIAFSSNRHNPNNVDCFSIYLIRPDGSDLRRFQLAGPEGLSDVDRERINHVCFNSDSSWLLFTANIGGVTADPVSLPNQFQPYGDMYMVRLDGSDLQRLTCNAYEDGTPSWGPSSSTKEEIELGSMSLEGNKVGGDKLKGQFEEPFWLSCNI
ncbi:uncharacterized protein LOC122068201 [Macadamia integrifolia]|uniref:uncharacterized protein LOC122068201 n=1 Tax=Macadamia integrifolia TaxID=60698 RepID=UPI001C4E823E|nr:uncharacterized protein LOC122068201 [Macadamia integrifolia]